MNYKRAAKMLLEVFHEVLAFKMEISKIATVCDFRKAFSPHVFL
jgi:hypothetical protein